MSASVAPRKTAPPAGARAHPAARKTAPSVAPATTARGSAAKPKKRRNPLITSAREINEVQVRRLLSRAHPTQRRPFRLEASAKRVIQAVLEDYARREFARANFIRRTMAPSRQRIRAAYFRTPDEDTDPLAIMRPRTKRSRTATNRATTGQAAMEAEPAEAAEAESATDAEGDAE